LSWFYCAVVMSLPGDTQDEVGPPLSRVLADPALTLTVTYAES
jgi:hypothetical protein